MDEAKMNFLEAHIPELAEAAATAAYWRTLAEGGSVMTCEDGVIYENFGDGTKRIVKRIEPPVRVAVGTRRKLK